MFQRSLKYLNIIFLILFWSRSQQFLSTAVLLKGARAGKVYGICRFAPVCSPQWEQGRTLFCLKLLALLRSER